MHKYAQALGINEAELITTIPQFSADDERAPQLLFPINNVEEVERAAKKAKEFHNEKSETLTALLDLLTSPESAKKVMRLVPELRGLLSTG